MYCRLVSLFVLVESVSCDIQSVHKQNGSDVKSEDLPNLAWEKKNIDDVILHRAAPG
jgi:hypothetical protein